MRRHSMPDSAGNAEGSSRDLDRAGSCYVAEGIARPGWGVEADAIVNGGAAGP